MRFLQKYMKTSGIQHLAWNENGGRPLAGLFCCAGRSAANERTIALPTNKNFRPILLPI